MVQNQRHTVHIDPSKGNQDSDDSWIPDIFVAVACVFSQVPNVSPAICSWPGHGPRLCMACSSVEHGRSSSI